jgi:hypothetical protein
MKTLKFIKETNNRWFVDLPEWKGTKEALEMVCGADHMLDILAQGEYEVTLNIDTDRPENGNYRIKLVRAAALPESGADYIAFAVIGDTLNELNFPIWLCDVTLFVYGYFPEVLYIL